MLGTMYPFEYELTFDTKTQDEGTEWYTARLRNISDNTLTDLEAHFHLVDAEGIVDEEAQSFGTLFPNEPETLSFLAHVSEKSQVYLSINGRDGKSNFFWDMEKGEVKSFQKISIKSRLEELNKDLHSKIQQSKQVLKQQEQEAEGKMKASEQASIAEIKDEYKGNKEAFDGWVKSKEDYIERTKRETKAKIEAHVAEVKNEDFTTWTKKNEEYVEEWMSGEANP